MNVDEFYRTVMGRRFIDGTVPRLVEAINRLAAALEEYNRKQANVSDKKDLPQDEENQ